MKHRGYYKRDFPCDSVVQCVLVAVLAVMIAAAAYGAWKLLAWVMR